MTSHDDVTIFYDYLIPNKLAPEIEQFPEIIETFFFPSPAQDGSTSTCPLFPALPPNASLCLSVHGHQQVRLTARNIAAYNI